MKTWPYTRSKTSGTTLRGAALDRSFRLGITIGGEALQYASFSELANLLRHSAGKHVAMKRCRAYYGTRIHR